MAKDEKQDTEDGGLPWWAYPLAAPLVPPALVLGLFQLPTMAFAAATIRPAVKIENSFLGILYALLLALICIASFAWPFVVIYLLPL
jgi:hypothetical protein